MLLLIVLLAHGVLPSVEAPITTITSEDIAGTPSGDIAGLHELWEEVNSACRKLPYGSAEGEAACNRRDAVSVQLGRLGWCFRHEGLQTKWETCPRR